MAWATSSAIERSSCAPLSMTSVNFSYTSSGRYLYIFWRLNTFLAKYSLGRSCGTATSNGRFLNASATASNLKFTIFLFFMMNVISSFYATLVANIRFSRQLCSRWISNFFSKSRFSVFVSMTIGLKSLLFHETLSSKTCHKSYECMKQKKTPTHAVRVLSIPYSYQNLFCFSSYLKPTAASLSSKSLRFTFISSHSSSSEP